MPPPKSTVPRSALVRPCWLIGVFVLLLTGSLLLPVLQYDFVAWDDDLHVSDNPRFQPLTWDRVLDFWRAPYARLYIPLTYTAWGALVWLTQALSRGPLTAELFHGLNVLLHLLNVLMVYRLGILVLSKGSMVTDERGAGAAAVGAILFGLHPLQVEALAWVSGLKDVLCGSGALLAVWQYLKYAQSPRGRWRKAYYLLASGAFALSLLAKPAAVVVPLLTVILVVQGLGQPVKATARALLGWFVVAGLWGVVTKGQQPDAVMGYLTPWWGRPLVAADALAFYLGKLTWPYGLGPDYGRTPQMVLGNGWGYLTGLVPLGLGLVLWQARRRLSGVVLAAGIFTAGLLPVLGLVPFLFQGHSTVADRYVYLAMLGPALGLSWVVQRTAHRKLIWIACGVLLGLLAWRSTEQVKIWRNTLTLFSHALRVNPQSAIAHGKLGTALAQQDRYAEAIVHYQAALRLRPNYVSAHNNLGHVLYKQGKLTEALAHYHEALRIEPDRADVHINLGLALAAQGEIEQAMHHYTKALQSPRHRVLAHTSLGRALAAQGQIEPAIAHYRMALVLNPEAVEAHYNLGNALMRLGQAEPAMLHYTEALRLKPDLAEVHNNLGSLMDDLGRRPEAIAHYRAALRLKPDLVEAHNNLGDAWLDLGFISEAVNAFKAAVRLRPDWGEAHYNLGIALTAQGQLQDAIAEYREALRLRPDWAEASLQLAWLLATQTASSSENVSEAQILAERVNRQSGGHNAVALHTLAVAYQAAGQETAAIQTAQRALAVAAQTSNRALMDRIQARFPQTLQEDRTRAQP